MLVPSLALLNRSNAKDFPKTLELFALHSCDIGNKFYFDSIRCLIVHDSIAALYRWKIIEGLLEI